MRTSSDPLTCADCMDCMRSLLPTFYRITIVINQWNKKKLGNLKTPIACTQIAFEYSRLSALLYSQASTQTYPISFAKKIGCVCTQATWGSLRASVNVTSDGHQSRWEFPPFPPVSLSHMHLNHKQYEQKQLKMLMTLEVPVREDTRAPLLIIFWEHTIYFNPFTPRSDQYINSPFHFNTLSSRKLTRIKKIIT